MFYKRQEGLATLESILANELSDCDFLAVDLPPIPDPALILDHTLRPIIEATGSAQLFPLVISTPDHNVLRIGFRNYEQISDYLADIGVRHVHPFALLNKVQLKSGAPWAEMQRMSVRADFEERALNKLAEMGIVRHQGGPSYKVDKSGERIQKLAGEFRKWFGENESDEQIAALLADEEQLAETPKEVMAITLKNLRRRFEFNNVRYGFAIVPAVDLIKDGTFSIYFGDIPKIHQFPEALIKLQRRGYNTYEEVDRTQRVYSVAMRKVLAHIESRVRIQASKWITESEIAFDKKDLGTKALADLECFVESYYASGNLEYTDLVSQPRGGASHYVLADIPNTFTLQGPVRAIRDTVAVHHGIQEADHPDWGVAQRMKEPGFDQEHRYEDHGVGVEYEQGSETLRVRIARHSEDPDQQVGFIKTLLRNMQKAVVQTSEAIRTEARGTNQQQRI